MTSVFDKSQELACETYTLASARDMYNFKLLYHKFYLLPSPFLFYFNINSFTKLTNMNNLICTT